MLLSFPPHEIPWHLLWWDWVYLGGPHDDDENGTETRNCQFIFLLYSLITFYGSPCCPPLSCNSTIIITGVSSLPPKILAMFPASAHILTDLDIIAHSCISPPRTRCRVSWYEGNWTQILTYFPMQDIE